MPKGNPAGYKRFGDPSSGLKDEKKKSGKKPPKKNKGK